MLKISNSRIIIFFLLVFMIAGAIIFSFHFYNRKNNERQNVVCTMEVLQCPDGSYVARTGPKCQFSKCPNQTSFIGILRKTSAGFNLLMQSPYNNSREVSYSLPLLLKVISDMGQIVGNKVEVFGSFTEGNTLNVNKINELKNNNPELGEVSVGKSVFVNGVKITLNKIIQDSRCPVDVQCIQAGKVVADVTLQSDTDKKTVEISSGSEESFFDSYKISLEDVSPSRNSKTELNLKDYKLTFKVIIEKFVYIKSSNNLIKVSLPFPDAVVGKDFSIIGKARGSWFFEASFPIEVLDKNGNSLVKINAKAQGDWMTENFVPFKVDIKIPDSYIGKATIVLIKDNPSGLTENAASMSFPITIEY